MIHHGDALERIRDMPSSKYHGTLCDPPYGISFMGHAWDHGVPSAKLWAEVLRVLKPGAHLLAFGGTRKWHRLACNIEDAGFEIRDTLMWVYGSGFPKSKNLEGGLGTALKPGWEPIILARRPLAGTVEQNVREHGVGAIAIDASRIGGSGGTRRSGQSAYPVDADGKEDRSGSWARTGHTVVSLDVGRWPANVILDEEAGALLDAQSGVLSTNSGVIRRHHAAMGYQGGAAGSSRKVKADSGGASRFFYCAKASRRERDAGCEELGGNKHPTVKPIALTTYLARLILPPIDGARMLTPFCGSGSEMLGALAAGWAHVDGIDSWDEACRTARARIANREGGSAS